VVAAGAVPGRYSFAGMPVELRVDGSVYQVNGSSLAGSALKLDDAVRNVVAWGIATPDEAVAMASTHALACIADALAGAGITLPESAIEWSPDLRVRSVRVGNERRDFAAEAAA